MTLMTPETIEYGQLSADELAENTRWWEIYEECFPLAIEREQPIAIIESVRRAVGAAFHAHENGQTIAIARTHILSDLEDFLSYIGVTKSYRRRGFGDALFRSLPKKDKVFEVEDPEHAALYGTTADACWKRIKWYQKHFGATLLDEAYLQPPLIDDAAPLPHRLMWTGEELKKERTLGIIWRIYEEFFHQANGVAVEDVKDCFARVSEME